MFLVNELLLLSRLQHSVINLITTVVITIIIAENQKVSYIY